MTRCDVGQRLKQRNGNLVVEAIASYDDGHEHDWVYADTRQPAGRHRLAVMLLGWEPMKPKGPSAVAAFWNP